MKKIIGVITARGGSKGIPGKNIAMVAGKPLIAWTIEEAVKSKSLDRVIVSTDSREIADISIKYGAEAPFLRPSEIAGDASPHVLAVEHAVKWLEENENYKPDYVMLLQPTAPLRIAEDIDGAIKTALEKDADSVISVSEMASHPYYSRKINSDGMIEDMFISRKDFLFRQRLPDAYTENGAIYLLKTEVLFREHNLMPEKIHAYIMPEERTLDIDTPWNLKLAELVLGAAKK